MSLCKKKQFVHYWEHGVQKKAEVSLGGNWHRNQILEGLECQSGEWAFLQQAVGAAEV